MIGAAPCQASLPNLQQAEAHVSLRLARPRIVIRIEPGPGRAALSTVAVMGKYMQALKHSLQAW